MTPLQDYDRKIRLWLLESDLQIDRLENLLITIINDLNNRYNNLTNKAWQPPGGFQSPLQLEMVRYEAISQLFDDTEAVFDLSIKYQSNAGYDALISLKKNLNDTQLKGFEILQFCKSFNSQLAAAKSLTRPADLDKLESEIRRITNASKQALFLRLEDFIISEINAVKEKKEEIKEALEKIKQAGEADLDFEEQKGVPHPQNAHNLLMKLVKVDPENESNWEEFIDYKGFKIVQHIKSLLKNELDVIRDLRKTLGEAQSLCRQLDEPISKDYQNALNGAHYDEAKKILSRHIGLEGPGKISDFKIFEFLFPSEHEEPPPFGRKKDSILDRLLLAYRLTNLQHEEKLETESTYVVWLGKKKADFRLIELDPIASRIASHIKDLLDLESQWKTKNNELERHEFDWQKEIDKRTLRKKAKRQRLTQIVDDIHAVLDELDEIACDNEVTKQKRGFYLK
jgi:hypothetical protein